ncbi:N-acyl homoserine lactonase family protein [Salinibacterium sp. SYSU T00001]|uniref:N-acyl homoserine lactonase family protein n=1 Tax=Homoserinimonas sedimenticola TaxID=2986805 RepID=UPI0022368657|nr:N-acyl homoserine lactonase family protein [Salinibacterium sedimenticola]MCW4385060.1 N-acyl homoserine lactonase family protein [Salinibacterium sedimenticola]
MSSQPVSAWPSSIRLRDLGSPRRLVPMVLGYEPISEALSIRGGRPERFLLEPVTAAALVYDEAWILLDTGFDVDVVRDPVRRGERFNYDSYTAVVPPGDPLRDQVAAAGLDWGRLAACAISHLHGDHSGGLRLVAGRAPLLIQAAEWEFATTVAGRRDVYFREDYLRPELEVVLLDGDTEIAPGLTALDTSGHTPGHQSFQIELADRGIVLACDAADLRACIDEVRPCGFTARPDDADAAVAAIRRLAELDRQGYEVWPGHDPEWPAWRSNGE